MTTAVRGHKQHLLLVSLGPIQDFIASARRCQDLWFGSWMLSDLARSVASQFGEQLGLDALIFPAGIAEDKPGVANKILIVCPAGTDPAATAEAGREAMLGRLAQLAKEAFDKVDPEHFLRDNAERQVEDLMEYLWVAVPLDDSGYEAARGRAEALLAARKNSRPWGPVRWQDAVPKSSLDGLRESVYHERLFRRQNSPEYRRRRYFVKGEERLCGVGVLKRAGSDPDSTSFGGRMKPTFHSTSQVATAPLLVRMAGLEAERVVEEFHERLVDAGVDLERFRIRAGGSPVSITDPLDPTRSQLTPRVFGAHEHRVRAAGFDGSLLFEDRIPSTVAEYSHVPDALVGGATEQLTTGLRGVMRALGVTHPTPYYAFLLADGDRMGRALDQLASQGLEAHRRLSSALEQFTRSCRDIVSDHAGSLIYAGGDDVLALLPLHTVLQCAARLEEAFRDAVASSFPDAPRDQRPTLSVGVGISHHMTPMSRARDVAREAERLAKVERDSLAIIVDKRSGGELRVTARWESDLPARLWSWVKLLRDEDLPDKAAFELERCLRPLMDEQGVCDPTMQPVALSLAKRALSRRRARSGLEPLAPEVARTLEQRFASDTDPMGAGLALSAELQVARLFLDAWRDAWCWGGAAEDQT